MKQTEIRLQTQGVKGGNLKDHGQFGLVKVYVDEKQSFSFDAFQGYADTYKRRENTQIKISNNGEVVFCGTIEELTQKLSN